MIRHILLILVTFYSYWYSLNSRSCISHGYQYIILYLKKKCVFLAPWFEGHWPMTPLVCGLLTYDTLGASHWSMTVLACVWLTYDDLGVGVTDLIRHSRVGHWPMTPSACGSLTYGALGAMVTDLWRPRREGHWPMTPLVCGSQTHESMTTLAGGSPI